MIFKIEPFLNYRIWGGDYLKQCFQRQDIKEPIGEVFLVSSLDKAESTIGGLPLSEFYKNNPQYFGLDLIQFPLRINLIDAEDDLSVQLHPLKENVRNKFLTRGIEEAWYIINTKANSQIVLGLKSKDINKVKEGIKDNNWESILNYLPVKAGDFAFLPAGFVHAIGKGNLVYEVTYNEEITYRLYDYQRIDKNTGEQRMLHHKEGLENLDLSATSKIETTSSAAYTTLVDKRNSFKVEKIVCNDSLSLVQENFYFYTVIKGQGLIEEMKTSLFGTYFVPLTQKNVNIEGQLELLRVTYNN